MNVDFWLGLLYFCHVILSILATVLLLIVILLLRRFDVFHVNLRLLLSQTLLCLLVNVCIQSLRPILAIFQTTAEKFDEKACAELNALPAPFCAFICAAGVLICMERLYATFNFAKYEHENFEWILKRIFGITWIIIGLYSLINLCFDIIPAFSTYNSSYLECQLREIGMNPLKTQWHLLFTLLFHFVFCLVICVVLSVNKEKQEVYVKFHYSSLSHRFQIAENVKSVRLLLKIVPQLALAVALLFLHSIWLYWDKLKLNELGENSRIIRIESSLLFLPFLASTIAFTIIRSSNVFWAKSKLIAFQLWLQIRYPVWWHGRQEVGGGGAVTSNGGQKYEICQNCGKAHATGGKRAFCEADLLREYWDDFLHIQ